MRDSIVLTLQNQTLWQQSPGLTAHKCWPDCLVWSSQSELFSISPKLPSFNCSVGFHFQSLYAIVTQSCSLLCVLVKMSNRTLSCLQLGNIFPRHPSGPRGEPPSVFSSSVNNSTNSASSSQPLWYSQTNASSQRSYLIPDASSPFSNNFQHNICFAKASPLHAFSLCGFRLLQCYRLSMPQKLCFPTRPSTAVAKLMCWTFN